MFYITLHACPIVGAPVIIGFDESRDNAISRAKKIHDLCNEYHIIKVIDTSPSAVDFDEKLVEVFELPFETSEKV